MATHLLAGSGIETESEMSVVAKRIEPTARVLIVAIEEGGRKASRPVDYLSWPMFVVTMIALLGMGAILLYCVGGAR